MAATAAVLTGDIIGSTDAGPGALDRAMDELADAARTIGTWPEVSDDTRFTRFRGDGWQLYVSRHVLGLRAALYILARLRAADLGLGTRIAIGMGSVESLGTADLGDAQGQAFELSGRALDTMKSWQTLGFSGGRPQGDALYWSITQLLAERAGRWSPQQAEAVALSISHIPESPTLETLSGKLGISSQAVSYRLQGAGWREVRDAVAAWETNLDHADKTREKTA